MTDLSRKGFNEAQLCEFAGWKQGSEMPRVYIHLVQQDVKNALLKAEGFHVEETRQTMKLPKKSNRCGNVSPSDSDFCDRCHLALTTQAALRVQEENEKDKGCKSSKRK
ncbi:MAG: hypothetical protein ACRECH_05380 [Nitrososphaerales archaeon]